MIKARVKQGAASRRAKDFPVHVQSLQQRHEASSSGTSNVCNNAVSGTTTSTEAGHSTNQKETGDFLTTLYLDTVFPQLFPFYQPETLAGGRVWLLKAINEDGAVKHAVISTSAYYFTLILARDANHTLRTPCEQHVWDTLALHMDSSLRIIKEAMRAYNKAHTSRVKADIFQQTHLLGAIVQQLIFDTVMAQGAGWNMHLQAALGLFCDIMETHGGRNGSFDLQVVLETMEPETSIFDGLDLDFKTWTTEQASLQFFVAFLIYADVISGIMTGTPPKLQAHHKNLIDDQGGLPALRMEEIIGCPGWILSLLGEISVVEASRRVETGNAKTTGGEEERTIIAALKSKLEANLAPMQSSPGEAFATSPLNSQRQQVANAWIHGAMLYLLVVEKGCQLPDTETDHHVQSIINTLESSFPSKLSLRTIMWPYFMAGLLAGPDDEKAFKEAVLKLGPLKAFGSAKEALGALERVWSLRGETTQSDWRLSDWLGSQNGFVLLV
ncbi:hypothetical protein FSARC_5316 [Fusarium sarcochroum]|uniref:Pestheic acid cluster transcriptional regulator 3 n=1 Tax=Fusarium sarcochroum TaxID=1208366 RepID=A0A8H4XA99_9HYPO|nr:hypothetical protein FSARC_5316 [Fusarium sarcochroum]